MKKLNASKTLIDDLVAPAILDFARREARKMLVGKTGFEPSCRQDEINALMISLAKAGRRVIRLSGAAHTGSDKVIAACRKAGIAIEVVPGVTEAGLKDTQQHDNAEIRVA